MAIDWRARAGKAVDWGSVGASAGATVGSIIPGVGTAVGAGVGTGIGALTGFIFGDTTEDELIDSYLSGEMSAEESEMIKRLIGDRFDAISREQGGRLGRAGLQGSSIAERVRADTDNSERQALADAFLRNIMARQQYGIQQLQMRDAARGESVGGAIETLGGLYSLQKDREAQGSVLNLVRSFLDRSDTPDTPLSDTPLSDTAGYEGSRRTNTPWYARTRFPLTEPDFNTTKSIINSNQGAGKRGASRGASRAAGAYGRDLKTFN